MSEMRKLAEKLKRGRREARNAERRRGKGKPARFAVKYGVKPGGAICCGAFANKDHMPAPIPL